MANKKTPTKENHKLDYQKVLSHEENSVKGLLRPENILLFKCRSVSKSKPKKVFCSRRTGPLAKSTFQN